MIKVALNDQIIGLDKIIVKNVHDLTLKDSISLIFHACLTVSEDSNDPDQNKWKSFYQDFQQQLEKQNKIGWPKILAVKNDIDKRIDSISHESFITSKHVLILLLRLLYVENYKRTYVYKSYHYHKVLNRKFSPRNSPINDITDVNKLSLDNIFSILQKQMEHYLKIYCDNSRFEHQLGLAILRQF